MKSQELTTRQSVIFDFIKWYIKNTGYPPTTRDIGDQFGIVSPNGVRCHLDALEKKGFISRTRNCARGIKVLA